MDVVVYERETDVGGVVRQAFPSHPTRIPLLQPQWFTSKYPGCRCDVPSIVYQFSWRTNIWYEMYAPAAENLAYLQTVTQESGFYRYIRFQHDTLEASWTNQDSQWALSVENLTSSETCEDKVDIFLEFNGPVR